MRKIKFYDVAIIALAIVVIAVLCQPGVIVKKAYTNPDLPETAIVKDVEILKEAAEEMVVEPTECQHTFGEYELFIMPGEGRNGIETRICETCKTAEEREYVCPHANVYMSERTEASCFESGSATYRCVLCKTVTTTEVVEKEDCSYGEWYTAKYATHLENGVMQRKCSVCGNVESYSFAMKMAGANAVYIPGTGINHTIHIGGFTQSDVDKYNIVYTTEAQSGANPFILGHNTGTMNLIQYTKVGQYIYVSINGTVEIYEVVVSEFGMQNDSWTDIIGQTTGTSLWDSVGEKTLHMYTCHGGTNGRWLVLAKLVGTM